MTSQIVITYILKTILISSIFLAYYWIALRDKKFHYYNRFYLLTASIMSLVIPLLNFDWFVVEKPVIYSSNEIVQFILPISNVNKSMQYDWVDYSLVIAGMAAITLFSILLLNVIKIQLLKRKSDVTQMEGFDFINTNDDNAPFSFLNNLFWKQSISLQEEGGQQIFKHEITHIQQKHTWDRIYSQIITSIFWMNPFNWIIQKELVTIHEFIADESAVGDSNVEAFAKMLLQTHYGNHFLNPTHQFFYSSIKRRLFMLNQNKKTKFSHLRRLFVLPITICVVLSFSIKTIEAKASAIIREKIENTNDLLVGDTTKRKGDNTNLQTNVAGHTAISNSKEEGPTIFNAPKIEKDLNPKKNNDPIFYTAEKPAAFPGGSDGWVKYLSKNLKIDLPVKNGAPVGSYNVVLNFVVQSNGEVTNIEAIKNPGYGTAAEAIRMIEKGPKWIPAQQNGKKVNYLMKQNFVFVVSE